MIKIRSDEFIAMLESVMMSEQLEKADFLGDLIENLEQDDYIYEFPFVVSQDDSCVVYEIIRKHEEKTIGIYKNSERAETICSELNERHFELHKIKETHYVQTRQVL